jgi:hypothetical protein
LSIAIVPAPVGGQGGEPAATVTIESVRAAWERTEAATKSIRVAARHTKTEKKGSISERLPAYVKADFKVTTDIPPADEAYTMDSTLTLSENKFKFEINKRSWSLIKGEYYDEPYKSTFDGKVGRVFHGNSQADGITGDGSIRQRSEFRDFNHGEVFPIMVSCRGANPVMGPSLSSATVSPVIVGFRGKRCAEICCTPQGTHVQIKLLLDCDAQYCLARFQTLVGNKPTTTIDVIESERTSAGPLPRRWITVHQGVHTFTTSTESLVTQFDIASPPFDKSEFALPYPKGTIVVDMRSDKQTTATGDPYQFADQADLPFFRRHRVALLLGGCGHSAPDFALASLP